MALLADPRHEAFVHHLMSGKSAIDAYVAAGFKRNNGNAGRLYHKPEVQARVAEMKQEAAEKAGITVQRVLEELGRVGFSDIRKLFDENGRLRRVEDLDEETAAFVSSVKVVTRRVQGGDEGEVEHVAEIKQWDKLSALEKIGKHLGMFTDKVEHSGPGGAPLVETADPAEVARRVAFLLAKGVKKA